MMPVVDDYVVSAGTVVAPEGAVLLGDAWGNILAKPSNAKYQANLLPYADAAFMLIDKIDIQSAPSPANILPVYLQGTSPWRKQHEPKEKP